jgi:excisionase family DNA binding protein
VILMEELLTAKEVAQVLRKHPYTVKRLIREGKIPAYLVGSSYRVKREDLDKYVEAQKIKKSEA